MKRAPVRLFRLRPPFSRRVVVGQITVGKFIELVRLVANTAATLRIAADKDITGEDLIRALREPELCAIADAVCLDQEPEFLLRWMSLGNVRKILFASTRTNRWERLAECINLSGGAPTRKGSIVTDITALCRIFPGLTPPMVRDWPMEEFLDVCEALNMASASDDPTEDDTARPAPLGAFSNIRGVEIVH